MNLKKNIVFWAERYFYNPTILDRFISYIFLPISLLYCFLMFLRFKISKEEDLGIKVIGIGNLTVGGSGKTPLTVALAKEYKNSAIVLRGYGRKSSGLIVVKDKNGINVDVDTSGDEAMIYATKLSHSVVIVSEDRKKAILKAKEMGCDIVFLDDAYSKHNIKKLDLVIDVKSKNSFCLPAGPFRERLYKSKKDTVVLKEGVDFKRVVTIKNKTDEMSLVTSIARPQRLDTFLPKVISKNYFEDHHNFTKSELELILDKDKSKSLLVTYKDYVKIAKFNIDLTLLDLNLEVDKRVFKLIEDYI